MALVNGGQLMARFLEDAGVRHIFSISGGSINPLYSAAEGTNIQIIHTRHDGAAAFMAEGYGRLTRGPGICALTLGTAVGMSTPAVITSHLAATPLVVLAGAAPRARWDQRPFSCEDQLSIMKPITKFARTVHVTARIPEYLSMALREATRGRPGPVFLDFPADVMSGKVEESQVCYPKKYRTDARSQGDPDLVREAVRMMARAKRPVVILGSGVWWSNAAEEVRRFVEQANVPVFAERMGRGTLPANHPLNFGLSAVASSEIPIFSLKRCDLLVMLGARFDYVIEYGEPPILSRDVPVVQVDIEPEEIGYNRDVELGIVGDLKMVANQMLKEMKSQGVKVAHSAWLKQLRAFRAQVEESIQPTLNSDETPIHPMRLIKEIRAFLDENTVVITSGGDIEQFGRWLLEPSIPGGSLRAGQTGSLGVDVPYTVAAKLARPDKRVIMVTGDGGFGYHPMEFDTADRLGLPFVVVIANDSLWAQTYYGLKLVYGSDGTKPMENVSRRYDQLVEVLGGHGEFVSKPEEIRPAIERAFQSGKPSCVNVVTKSVASPETLWFSSPDDRARRMAL
jgi:acetolactate synthase-1/2/3 large subunit